jgi:hypothetical protein
MAPTIRPPPISGAIWIVCQHVQRNSKWLQALPGGETRRAKEIQLAGRFQADGQIDV